jgi:hypothetical protein
MDYLYENLGDERFQEFCSSLINKEFSNMQAFPVGQPDGGRDSVAYSMDKTKKEFIVFQVKFVKNANQERDIHKWLTETIEKEVKKIDRLILRGAKAYYLLTNVRGTAHLDVGSKDKMNKILENNISIPSMCWWRDDLSSRFEKDPQFKWVYPEILNGQDILNSILFNNLNENKERRESVIRAYLVDQFEIDNEVKFKQIDLQNRLLDLFADVPLRVRKFNEKNRALKRTLYSLGYDRVLLSDEDIIFYDDKPSMGAAEFLLHTKVQNEIERVILEGGPGQGKSTISQYICQVHRVRLLNKVNDMLLIPKELKGTPIRLPFKIDLRDIAAWVEKKNPYQAILSDEYFEKIWKNSLEAFFVAHVFYHSKLEEFTSIDFISICKLSHVLFVFDGFDEIANIKVRGEVIEFINKGITRLTANAKSIQVLITSRPAALTDSVGFSTESYPHFELTDITPSIINIYVDKWIKASKLDSRDASQLKGLIRDKLEMPHLKDLAKSPMQLAILISLLRTKGQSLPNKRTALYDSYISLFFDRESEKNTLIRDKRDLIIDIHQYLAWVLHSEAELYKNSGRIHIDDLHIRLKEYLENEGHDSSIADQLFNVMKERVCALVSRVQGTFEFEVQPLREYFCAKYLYESAPHSSAGSVKRGTKPDRLRAILRNYYWQNVVRFFAGCVDVGELDMLIQELNELQVDTHLKYTDLPRVITSQILSDYVFTQKPLKLKNVVKNIVSGINIGHILNQDRSLSSNPPILLPNECGRKEIIKECFDQLSKLPNNDFSIELIGVINNNPLDKIELWMEYLPSYTGVELTKWLSFAYRLQLIHKIDETVLHKIITEDPSQIIKRIQLLINGNRIDLINKHADLRKITYKAILDQEVNVFSFRSNGGSLFFLSLIVNPYILGHIFYIGSSDQTFINSLERYSGRRSRANESRSVIDFEIANDIDQLIKDYADSISSIFNTTLSHLTLSLDEWDVLVECGRKFVGDCWSFKIIATISAAIKSRAATFDDHNDLHDSSISLCKRVRYARLKSGNVKFWESHFEDSTDLIFTLLVFFTWATPKTIVKLYSRLSDILDSLSSSEYSNLIHYLLKTTRVSQFNKTQQKYMEKELSEVRNLENLKYILSLRVIDSPAYVYKNVEKLTGFTNRVDKDKFQFLLRSYLNDQKNTSKLAEIKAIYKKIGLEDEIQEFHGTGHVLPEIPYEVAKKIMTDCKEYPRIIASLAENVCRNHANENTKPIGEIAKDDCWFLDS